MYEIERRKIIGNRLMMLRGNRTQKEVALALGISEARVRHYESGRCTPKDSLKQVIADYFKVNMVALFFNVVGPFPFPENQA